MSVLVRGMKMPESCEKCYLTVFDGYEREYVCVFSGISALNIGRQAACPLIEIRPHGRLIDAAELQRDIHKHDYVLVDEWNSKDSGMFTKGIDYAISVAPTIIEAEGGAEE